MRTITFLVAFLLCASVMAAEGQSVLVKPLQAEATVQQQPPVEQVLPQQILVFRKGLFNSWKAEVMTLSPAPVYVMRPAPRPVVIWTPSVIWR